MGAATMNQRFIRKLKQAKTFNDWLDRLKRFDYELIKSNNLQMWTVQDFKNRWKQYKGEI